MCRSGSVTAGDRTQRIASLDRVGGVCGGGVREFLLFDVGRIDVLFQIGGVLPVNLLFAGDVLAEVVLGEYQRVAFDRSRDDVHFVLRIECPQSFDGNVECRGYLSQVEQAGDADRIGRQRHGRVFALDTVLLVVGIGIGGSDEGRYIPASFAGQVFVDVPEGRPSAGAGQGFVYVARAAVVGGDGECPVVVDAVKVLQITAGGAGRLHRVPTFIDERIDLQSVTFACRGHELPQSDSTHRRGGRGRESRFDDRQGTQLDGQVGLDELFLDQREIVA